MHILHRLPGRIRLYVPELWQKEDALILRGYLKSLDGITECKANHRRSSVLIVYDPARIKPDQLQHQIDFSMSYLKTCPNPEKRALLSAVNDDSRLDAQAGAARKVVFFALLYLLYKWKQSKFGKFALSRSIPWLQASSLVTILGGYPLLKTYYKKYTRPLPGDSEDQLKQASVFFTLVRESAKGVFVLALKTLNDWLKFSADINNYRQWQQEDECRFYMVEEQDLCKMLPAAQLQKGSVLTLAAGQLVPARGCVTDGEAAITLARETRVCQYGHYVKAGSIIKEGRIKLELVENGKPGKKPVIDLDDVHQPETPYQGGITRVALSGALLSYLMTGSSLNALAVLLLMSPSAGNAAVSSGLNNCVYRFSRKNIMVPDPNRLLEISECRQVVMPQELFRRYETGPGSGNTAAAVVEDLKNLGLDVAILADRADQPAADYPSVTFITSADYARQQGPSILVGGASSPKHSPAAYTVLITGDPADKPADIMVCEGQLRDLPDILKDILYTRKVISQSVFFTQAFNIWYGARAIFSPFDAFAAKSLNTTNSLVALLANHRILARK
ncbi:MAG: hypothetical protein VB084_09385 [Syntrophomonadaceae bacterium]|nr:hypothetical protein [Syntrophomonadaceae bacterium]